MREAKEGTGWGAYGVLMSRNRSRKIKALFFGTSDKVGGFWQEDDLEERIDSMTLSAVDLPRRTATQTWSLP
jgi:hypothetical protein